MEQEQTMVATQNNIRRPAAPEIYIFVQVRPYSVNFVCVMCFYIFFCVVLCACVPLCTLQDGDMFLFQVLLLVCCLFLSSRFSAFFPSDPCSPGRWGHPCKLVLVQNSVSSFILKTFSLLISIYLLPVKENMSVCIFITGKIMQFQTKYTRPPSKSTSVLSGSHCCSMLLAPKVLLKDL